MDKKTCCVTGHRNIPADQVEFVKCALRKEIQSAIAAGYTRFICGFAEGVDQYFAEIVAEKRKTNPHLRLEAAIPYRNRYFRLLKAGYAKGLLEACTDLSIISEQYAPNVYRARNRYMVKCSDLVIAVYDGREKGGTVSTLQFAYGQRKEIRKILIGFDLTSAQP